MTRKKSVVRYPQKCINCGNPLLIDDVAYFDVVARKMWCSSCNDAEPDVVKDLPTVSVPEVTTGHELSRNDLPPTYSPSPKEAAISKAHDENMQANQQLVLQLATLNKALIDLMNELKNLTFAIRKGGNA